MEDLVGQTLLGRYHIQEFIGRGGMAEVYRAYDLRRRIPVALKFLREDLAEDEVFLRRFRREATVLESLQHPNIVRYYGFEESDDHHFLVAEFIEGEGLRKKLSRLTRPLTLAQTLYILESVCNALHYAHAEGIYHCDVKPANIMIDSAGRVVVADFGISRLAESATITGGTPGTPAYMAPEQCRGQKVDARTDVYALAISAFEMLTLDRPFTADLAPIKGPISERIRWEQLKAPPPSIRQFNPKVPDWAEKAILRALQKPKNKRFKSVVAFYDALSNGGKVVPDPNLPWLANGNEDLNGLTLIGPSTPRGATLNVLWERRINDAVWTLRRGKTRLLHRVADAWEKVSQPGALLARVKALFSERIPLGRLRLPARWPLHGLLAIVVVVGIAFALTRPMGGANVPAGTVQTPPATPAPTQERPTTMPTRAEQPSPSLVIEAERANVRAGPSTLYPILISAAHGDVFDVVARSPDGMWYNICCVDGRSAWVHADLVRVESQTFNLPVVTPTPPIPQQVGGAG